jgi:alkaline phosphatase
MGWLTGYSYQKQVTISGTSAGAQTNYQMKLIIGESSTAPGIDVHCENHCQDFPNDIRFTNASGNAKHDYWIEETEGTTPNRYSTVWIEVNSITASGTVDLYMYYCNSAAASNSNGTTTFDFFDDFTDTLKPDYVCSFGLINSVEHTHGASLTKINNAVSAFNSWNPDFVVELGDFIDDDTATHDLTALQEVEATYDNLTMSRKYVLGNHDLDTLTKATFISHVGMSEKYYSFDVGNYHFIVLDDMYDASGNDLEAHGINNPSRYISDTEKTWLTNDLNNTTKKTIIFVEAHLYGMISAQMIQNAADIRTILENSGKVLACFHGHSGTNQVDTINGIAYYAMRAMDQASPNAYAKVAIYSDNSIRIEGINEQYSYPFSDIWTLGGDGSFDSDELQIGTDGRAYASYSVPNNSCCRAKVKISVTNNRIYFVPFSESPEDDGAGVYDGMHYDLPLRSNKDWRLRHFDVDLIFGGDGFGVSLNIWHNMDLIKQGTSWKCILDDIEKGNTTYTYSTSHPYIELAAYASAGGGGTVKYDNVFVRKCVSPEPTWGSWGNEKTESFTTLKSINNVLKIDIKSINKTYIINIKNINKLIN